MRVAAALCWYDEPTGLLERCVASVAPFVDHVVAVDGTWQLWERSGTSSADQAEAIRRTCQRHGVSSQVVTGRLWETQSQKRSHAIRLAAAAADWVMPLDADWTFEGDPVVFRVTLDTAAGDSGVVDFWTPPGGNADLFHRWHRETAGVTQELALVWRALPDIRCEPEAHWCYTAERNGGRVSLWGPTMHPDARQFRVPGFRIVHHCFDRDPDRVRANVDYVTRREELKLSVGYEP